MFWYRHLISYNSRLNIWYIAHILLHGGYIWRYTFFKTIMNFDFPFKNKICKYSSWKTSTKFEKKLTLPICVCTLNMSWMGLSIKFHIKFYMQNIFTRISKKILKYIMNVRCTWNAGKLLWLNKHIFLILWAKLQNWHIYISQIFVAWWI